MRTFTGAARAVSRHRRMLILLLIGAGILCFSGCKTTTPPDSSMPWAQPAEWERQNVFSKMGAGF